MDNKKEIHNHFIYEQPSYTNIKSNIIIKQSLLLNYHDMLSVARLADNCLMVRPPVLYSISGKSHAEHERIFEENHKFFDINFKKNIKASRKLDFQVYSRKELFSNISEVYPEFGQNMKSKISGEDYELYHTYKRNLKSLFTHDVDYKPLEPSSETLKHAQDKLSEVIDSSGFSKACEIEDRFMLSELDTFFDKLPYATKEQRSKLSKPTILREDGQKISTLDLAKRVREEEIARLKKYAEISELYDKLNKKVDKNRYIELKTSTTDDISK